MTGIEAIEAGLKRVGLQLFGGFNFDPSEDAPPGPSGRPATAVMLVGNAGGIFWPHFARWRDLPENAGPDPLDRWSRAIVEEAASAMSVRVVMPNDRPYAPFQQWARRAGGGTPSPLGVLMHPRYGIWHSYRAALLFDDEVDAGAVETGPGLCGQCVGRPCLAGCPVGAFDGQDYAYGRCLDHVRSRAGTDCRDRGCRARNACPYHAGYRYAGEMQAWLMRVFSR